MLCLCIACNEAEGESGRASSAAKVGNTETPGSAASEPFILRSGLGEDVRLFAVDINGAVHLAFSHVLNGKSNVAVQDPLTTDLLVEGTYDGGLDHLCGAFSDGELLWLVLDSGEFNRILEIDSSSGELQREASFSTKQSLIFLDCQGVAADAALGLLMTGAVREGSSSLNQYLVVLSRDSLQPLGESLVGLPMEAVDSPFSEYGLLLAADGSLEIRGKYIMRLLQYFSYADWQAGGELKRSSERINPGVNSRTMRLAGSTAAPVSVVFDGENYHFIDLTGVFSEPFDDGKPVAIELSGASSMFDIRGSSQADLELAYVDSESGRLMHYSSATGQAAELSFPGSDSEYELLLPPMYCEQDGLTCVVSNSESSSILFIPN